MTTMRLQYMMHPVSCSALVTPEFDADHVLALVCRFDVPSHKIVSSARKFDEAPPCPAEKTCALSSMTKGFGTALSTKHEDRTFRKAIGVQLVNGQLCRSVLPYYAGD